MEIISDNNSKSAEHSQKGYNVNIGGYINKGWELLRKRTDYFILYTLILFIASSIPVLDLFVILPLAAGIPIAAYYLDSGKQIVFEDFFDGFKHFAGLLLFTFVAIILIFLGFLALILPGIYLSVGYIFAPFYIVFKGMDFWDAMETSRKLVHREWFSIFGFLVVLVFINFLGVLAFGIGLLITVPLSYCAVYAAFDDIVGISK